MQEGRAAAGGRGKSKGEEREPWQQQIWLTTEWSLTNFRGGVGPVAYCHVAAVEEEEEEEE